LITKVCARPPGPGASDRQVGGRITRSASVLETCPRNARTHSEGAYRVLSLVVHLPNEGDGMRSRRPTSRLLRPLARLRPTRISHRQDPPQGVLLLHVEADGSVQIWTARASGPAVSGLRHQPPIRPAKTAAGPQSVLKTMVTAGSHCVMTVNVTAGQSIWSVPDPRSDVRSQSPAYRSAHRHSGLDWQRSFSAKTSDDVPPVVPENRYQSAGATESATRRTTNGNFIRLLRRRDSRRD
jgi:hypothetical protein